jgi:RimJ/RimL family protein N-acetyltransferase
MPLPWTPAYPVRTARLDLRPHTPADLDDLFQFHSDPEVVRHIPWPVRTLEETRAALAVKVQRHRVDAAGDWIVLAMEVRATGQVIGEVVLACVDVEAGEGELGFALHSGFQRRGYGSEAARAMLELAFGPFGLRRVTAMLDVRNAASAGLLESLGFERERVDTGREFKGEIVDEAHYALLADDFARN